MLIIMLTLVWDHCDSGIIKAVLLNTVLYFKHSVSFNSHKNVIKWVLQLGHSINKNLRLKEPN